jgi:uncharacterized protein (DUF1501 family)
VIDPDISTADAVALLSSIDAAERDGDPSALSRRSFLQLVAMGVGAGLSGGALLDALGATVPGFSASALAAPVGPHDGIVVVIGMYGGNDGLNTVVPFDDGAYVAQHGPLALPRSATLPLDDEVGLNSALVRTKSLWDAGQLAIVDGVGYPNPDLSHFNSMAYWMSARTVPGSTTSGWLGRWLDGHLAGGPDLYAAAAIGSSVPLHVIGQHRRATAIPVGAPKFGGGTADADMRLHGAVRALAGPAGQGAWHDAISGSLRDQIDLAARLQPVLTGDVPPGPLIGKLDAAARLINADLGFRVLEASWGDFDSHANQPSMHPARMQEFDAAIGRFFDVLDARWARRVAVVTFSEFGRTSYANAANGTDHGTASCMFVMGANVKGGRYGQRPALANLGRWDRMAHHVDFRSYYASILGPWMGGSASDVLGGTYEDLRLFRHGPGEGPGPETPPSTTPATTPTTTPTPVPPPATSPGSSSTTGFAGVVPLSPARIADTRDGTGGVRIGRLGPGQRIRVPILGRGGVPRDGVAAVVVNVTATEVGQQTYFTVYPGATTRPSTSNLNPSPGRSTPNLSLTALGADGTIEVYNHAGHAHCVVDVFGYVVRDRGARLTPVVPARLLDTRIGVGAARRRIGSADRIDLQVTGRGGVPTTGVSAVVVNLTAVAPASSGFLAVGPAGEPAPPTSNVNFVQGQVVPNLVLCKIGRGGKVSITTRCEATDVVADVFAYVGTHGSGVRAAAPVRILDTRDGTGAPRRAVTPTRPVVLEVGGRLGVPPGATAVVLNVTVASATRQTFVTVWPDGAERPDTSNLNVVPGRPCANLVVVKLGTSGRIRLVNGAGEVALVADVMGYAFGS